MALVMVTHEGIDRHEVEAVLRRRWPDVVVKELEQEEPTVAMSPEDAADLGRCRRGVEPLRIVVMPQHDRQDHLARRRADAGSRLMGDHRPRAILHRNERSSGDRSFRLSAGR